MYVSRTGELRGEKNNTDSNIAAVVATVNLQPRRLHTASAFDEEKYQTQPLSDRGNDFYENKVWLKHHRAMIESYFNLYIFADEYSVHQLRDDILTAMLGQAHNWDVFPHMDEELVAAVTNHLPGSAKFTQFLALGTAFFWLPNDYEDAVTKLN